MQVGVVGGGRNNLNLAYQSLLAAPAKWQGVVRAMVILLTPPPAIACKRQAIPQGSRSMVYMFEVTSIHSPWPVTFSLGLSDDDAAVAYARTIFGQLEAIYGEKNIYSQILVRKAGRDILRLCHDGK